MGCFDTVRVPCPKCKNKEDFQSKGGNCTLTTYELLDCPADVMSDINRHAPITCSKCGTEFFVSFKIQVSNIEVMINKEK